MYEDKSKRATGRTTRMVQEAVRVANMGHTVWIVMSKMSDRYIGQMVRQELENNGIKQTMQDNNNEIFWHSTVVGHYRAGIKFVTTHETMVDMQQFRVRGTEDMVVFDHFAIETHYAKVFELAHQWDK